MYSGAFPETYTIGYQGQLSKMLPSEFDDDYRGIVWMYEPPQKHQTYVMGIDPALGRTGWNRYVRCKEDQKTNNGAIEIIRVGRNNGPDVQVCEFAAPVDAFELGTIANMLGRLYGGTADDDQCQCILETFPGPGGMTLRQMQEHGYFNHWMWQYYAEQYVQQSKSPGWTATSKSVRDLWVKCSRHIILRNAIVRSPFLVEQFMDAEYDSVRGHAVSPNNKDGSGHGDSLRAFNLALWAARGWSMDDERTKEPVVVNKKQIDWQASDMTMDEIMDGWANTIDRMYS